MTAVTALSLSACLSGDETDPSRVEGLSIDFTNPAQVASIQTPDFVVNITGTVESVAGVGEVAWQNDRGGKGMATGKENWATGNIVLQVGANVITVSAEDVNGLKVSKTLTVEREDTTGGGGNEESAETVMMYSYEANLANAAPVSGASIQPKQVYFFVEPGDEWSRQGFDSLEIRCCKGMSGPGEGENFSAWQTADANSWSRSFDLSSMQAGGTRRVQTKANFGDGTSSGNFSYEFVVAGSSTTPNRAPSISGSPSSTASAGNQYSFRPTATDPDGDTMQFTVQNKPGWASFNKTNGRLYGTPTANDVGIHGDISITVSDGQSSSRLGPFAIEVEAFSNGSATLSWVAPTKREDGSALTNLAGFNVYYGQTSKDYANKVKIDNPGIATYMVDNLSNGTWYFVVTAYDADGRESNPSTERSKGF